MKRAVAGMGMLIGMLWLSVAYSVAATNPHSAHKTESDVPDVPKTSLTKRTALNLPPAAQDGLRLTMREHLEAIEAIVAALAREDFTRAATLANEELGFPKHHVAMQREQGATFPPAYHDLAMAHHQAAEALGAVLPTKDLQQILPQLEQTIHACVKCHQAFRLQD
ncbi:MAG: cytochrome c [Nitrospirota bacterium]|nr:cytochrome c [Nitrospirota bacterium]MDH5573940.1 cytochrome c [Nitrospirota bacterium]